MSLHLSIEDQLYLFGLLKTNKLIGQIWPVYRWDNGPPVYSLLVDRDLALQEVSRLADIEVTERQLRTVLDRFCRSSLGTQIEGFYGKRRQRRIAA